MAITSVEQTLTGPFSVRVSAASNLVTPIFRWYVEGRRVQEGTLDFFDLNTRSQKRVDVLDQDTPGDPDSVHLNGVVSLAWERGVGYERYRVEKDDFGSWKTVTQRRDQGAVGPRTFRVTLPQVADEEVLTLRVMGVRPDGAETELVRRTALVVRFPDVPEFDATVSGGVITAS